MVVRGKPTARQTTAKKPTARRGASQRRAAATSTRKVAPKTATKPSSSEPPYDVDKMPTDYHKQFARWIMRQCGYDPENAKSKTIAFLYGVSIATASRPVFMKSDELATWREETGQAKRGPKPKNEGSGRRRNQRQNVSDDEFEDDSEEFEDEEDFENETDADDEEFDEDSDEDDDEFEDESEEDDDEFEDEEEEEPEPPKRRGRPTNASRKAPAKTRTTSARSKAKSQDDDDFVF